MRTPAQAPKANAYAEQRCTAFSAAAAPRANQTKYLS